MPKNNLFKIGAAAVAATAGVILAITSAGAHAAPSTTGHSVIGGILSAARAASFPVFASDPAPNTLSDEKDQDAIEAAEAAAARAAELQKEAAERAAKLAALQQASACRVADQAEDAAEKAADQAEDAAEIAAGRPADETEDASERAADKAEDASEPSCRPVGLKTESSEHHFEFGQGGGDRRRD